MNQLQRRGAFRLRLAGCVLLAVGVIGLVYLALLAVSGQDISIYPSGRRIASVLWVVLGVVLLLASKPLGRLLGRGLD